MDERLEISLERISDFRLELNKLMKKSLLDFSISPEELKVALLFASMDIALNRAKSSALINQEQISPKQVLLDFMQLAIQCVEENY